MNGTGTFTAELPETTDWDDLTPKRTADYRDRDQDYLALEAVAETHEGAHLLLHMVDDLLDRIDAQDDPRARERTWTAVANLVRPAAAPDPRPRVMRGLHHHMVSSVAYVPDEALLVAQIGHQHLLAMGRIVDEPQS
jgi:hypothetical protein